MRIQCVRTGPLCARCGGMRRGPCSAGAGCLKLRAHGNQSVAQPQASADRTAPALWGSGQPAGGGSVPEAARGGVAPVALVSDALKSGMRPWPRWRGSTSTQDRVTSPRWCSRKSRSSPSLAGCSSPPHPGACARVRPPALSRPAIEGSWSEMSGRGRGRTLRVRPLRIPSPDTPARAAYRVPGRCSRPCGCSPKLASPRRCHTLPASSDTPDVRGHVEEARSAAADLPVEQQARDAEVRAA